MSKGITPFKEYYRHDYDSDETRELYDAQYPSGPSSSNVTYETNTSASSDEGEKTSNV